MSHSSSATLASTTQPLSDILPWGAPMSVSSGHGPASSRVDARTLLVTDACATDGRFLLHTLALQFLSSRHAAGAADATPRRGPDPGPPPSLEGAVLWISCAPVTEQQILSGLRKGVQHNLGGAGAAGAAGAAMGGNGGPGGISRGQGGVGDSSGRLHIVSVPLELADAALEQDNEDASTFSHELYLKRLHKRIVHWLHHRELPSRQQPPHREHTSPGGATSGPNIVIMDNVTALGALCGARLTNAFVSSVRASLQQHARRCARSSANVATRNGIASLTVTHLLAIRASSPDDGGLYQIDGGGDMKGEKLRSEYARLLRPWLGFGSGPAARGAHEDGAGTDLLHLEELANYLSISSASPPSIVYACGLYEIADGIVDVSPLESGYSRDVLGRLSFATSWSGRGWWGTTGSHSGTVAKNEDAHGTYSSMCVNYRCDDSGVRVMRLRT